MRAKASTLAIFLSLSLVSSWAASPKPHANLMHQPMAFEPNRGQTDKEVKYLARGNGYALFLTASEAVLRLRHASKESVLRVGWVGANSSASIAGENQLPGRVNYLRGNDPSKWLADINTFRKVRLAKIYDGVDLVFYGSQHQLEYDFVVAPGADPRQIRLAFDGAEQLRLDRYGDLVLKVKGGELRQHKPIVYQLVRGKQKRVEGRFILAKDNTASFALGSYDHTRELVIDPTLSYSTYLGGNGDDAGLSIAVDGSNRAYITGFTQSTDFPVKGGSLMSAPGQDAFVTKFWATGGGVIYSTYLGGTDFDTAQAIAVDRFGNAYIAGFTVSPDFPTTPGAYQQTKLASTDGFVTKLNPSGNGLVYSTYIGGNEAEGFNAIALDNQHRVYVTGDTTSSDYPLVNPADPTMEGFMEAVVTRLNADGSSLSYSTYLGGSEIDFGGGIAVDSSYRAYVTGATLSPDFPTTTGAFQRTYQGGVEVPEDAFVTRLSADGSTFSYSTYLGGRGGEIGQDIAVDNQNRAYVTGVTGSPNFPTTTGAFDRTRSGDSDAFVTRMSSTGGSMSYSTLLGGTSTDEALSIAVDSSYRAWITGETLSANFPASNAIDASYNGEEDAFVTKLWATGGGLIFSTFLGGSLRDIGYGVRLDGSGNGYVTGRTSSTNFRTTTGAYRRSKKARDDAFVAKITK